jgi:phage gp45-like
MIRDIQKMLRPLALRIANLVARGVVRLVDDGKKLQLLQVDVLTEETRDEVERVQNYGFTSVPLDGAEAVVLFVNGRREHGLVVAVEDRRHRLTELEPGEVAVYSESGSKVLLKVNGDVEITPASGVVKVIGDVTADGISLKSHTHGIGTIATTATIGATPTVGVMSGSTGEPE